MRKLKKKTQSFHLDGRISFHLDAKRRQQRDIFTLPINQMTTSVWFSFCSNSQKFQVIFKFPASFFWGRISSKMKEDGNDTTRMQIESQTTKIQKILLRTSYIGEHILQRERLCLIGKNKWKMDTVRRVWYTCTHELLFDDSLELQTVKRRAGKAAEWTWSGGDIIYLAHFMSFKRRQQWEKFQL